MNKPLIMGISLFINVSVAFGQVLTIPLSKCLEPPQQVSAMGKFRHYVHTIPLQGLPTDTDTTMYWVCPMTERQFNYEEIKRGIGFDYYPDGTIYDYSGDVNTLGIKEKDYTEQAIKNNIYAISALRNGRKLVIVDANNNHDLSDDILIEVDTAMSFEDRLSSYTGSPFIMLNYEVLYQGRIVSRHKTARIKPLGNMIPPPQNKLTEDIRISINTNEYYTGTFSGGQ